MKDSGDIKPLVSQDSHKLWDCSSCSNAIVMNIQGIVIRYDRWPAIEFVINMFVVSSLISVFAFVEMHVVEVWVS